LECSGSRISDGLQLRWIWLESIQKIFTVYLLFTIFTENSQCLTRNLEPGICKNFYSCNTLLDAITQNRLNLKTDAYSTIRHCGFAGIVPIVCCPNKPVALSSKSEKGKEEHFNCLKDKFWFYHFTISMQGIQEIQKIRKIWLWP
jgi:Regulatory CLIP domain of proteinases